MAEPIPITSFVTSIDGITVETTSTNDSSSKTLTMKVATMFSHALLTQGPRTARSLQRRTRNTVALGSRMPASACTAVVIRPRGARGISTIAAARATMTA